MPLQKYQIHTPHQFFLSLQVTLKTGGAQVRRQVGSADSVFYSGDRSPFPHSSGAFSAFNSCFPSRPWHDLCSWARKLRASCAQGLWGTNELLWPGLRQLGPEPWHSCWGPQPEPSRWERWANPDRLPGRGESKGMGRIVFYPFIHWPLVDIQWTLVEWVSESMDGWTRTKMNKQTSCVNAGPWDKTWGLVSPSQRWPSTFCSEHSSISPVKEVSIHDLPGGPEVRTQHFPLQRAWVWSMVRELRSHKPLSMAKKKKSGFPWWSSV